MGLFDLDHLPAGHGHYTAAMNSAATVTYSGASAGLVVWGLDISSWAALVSIAVALLGLALQVYVAVKRANARE